VQSSNEQLKFQICSAFTERWNFRSSLHYSPRVSLIECYKPCKTDVPPIGASLHQTFSSNMLHSLQLRLPLYSLINERFAEDCYHKGLSFVHKNAVIRNQSGTFMGNYGEYAPYRSIKDKYFKLRILRPEYSPWVNFYYAYFVLIIICTISYSTFESEIFSTANCRNRHARRASFANS